MRMIRKVETVNIQFVPEVQANLSSEKVIWNFSFSSVSVYLESMSHNLQQVTP